MCRWLAYAGPPIYLDLLLLEPEHSLENLSSLLEMIGRTRLAVSHATPKATSPAAAPRVTKRPRGRITACTRNDSSATAGAVAAAAMRSDWKWPQ